MDQKQKALIALVVGLVLVAASWLMFWPPDAKITQGLDIQGGLSVILTAQETTTTKVTGAVMDRAELIVNNRVNKLGASEASIQKQGNDSILVQLPGIKNAEDALKVLGSTGQLEFVDVGSITDSATVSAIQSGQQGVNLAPGTYTALMTGEVVTNASVGTDPTTQKITVDVTMNNTGRDTWATYTTNSVGKQVAIVLDGKVQSAPVVNEPITDGRTQISGSFTAAEAKNLRTVLETGALPVTLKFSDSRVVGPTLGQQSLKAGVTAILAGIGIVMLYLLIFYRGLGVLSWIAMFCFASFYMGTLALLSQFGWFALTLPGIAGIVLTVGVAADSSILMNETVPRGSRSREDDTQRGDQLDPPRDRHEHRRRPGHVRISFCSLSRGDRSGSRLRPHAHARHPVRHRDDADHQAASHRLVVRESVHENACLLRPEAG